MSDKTTNTIFHSFQQFYSIHFNFSIESSTFQYISTVLIYVLFNTFQHFLQSPTKMSIFQHSRMKVPSHHEHKRMFGRLYPFSLQGFCTNGRYYNSDLFIPKFRRQLIHYCPVNSFPTNPTSIGMRVPKNPPS